MEVLGAILQFLDTQMETPTMYGAFHLVCFALSIGIGILLCLTHRDGGEARVRRVVLIVAVLVTVLEIYKQINFTFSYEDGAFSADYQWYAFPWQFCSMPMYVGLLTFFTKKGWLHDALYAFLATYAVFAGLCVMLYPSDVFIGTVGICIQTMVCHGSMLTIGIYLWYTGAVKAEHKTVLKAVPVFATGVLIAVVLNEIAALCGIAVEESFNMFYVSRHLDGHLPVYSEVQKVVPYPWNLLIYIAGFTLAAYVVQLIAMGLRLCGDKLARAKKGEPEC